MRTTRLPLYARVELAVTKLQRGKNVHCEWPNAVAGLLKTAPQSANIRRFSNLARWHKHCLERANEC